MHIHTNRIRRMPASVSHLWPRRLRLRSRWDGVAVGLLLAASSPSWNEQTVAPFALAAAPRIRRRHTHYELIW